VSSLSTFWSTVAPFARRWTDAKRRIASLPQPAVHGSWLCRSSPKRQRTKGVHSIEHAPAQVTGMDHDRGTSDTFSHYLPCVTLTQYVGTVQCRVCRAHKSAKALADSTHDGGLEPFISHPRAGDLSRMRPCMSISRRLLTRWLAARCSRADVRGERPMLAHASQSSVIQTGKVSI